MRMRISSLSLATIHYYFNSILKENATPKKQKKKKLIIYGYCMNRWKKRGS